MAWMIQMNGFLVDARILKREFQGGGVPKGADPLHPRQSSERSG